MSRLALTLLLSAAASILPCKPAAAQAAEGLPPDPIRFMAHGGFFGPDGRQIVATPAWVRATLDGYAQGLLRRASPSQRVVFDGRRAHIAQVLGGDAVARLYATSLLLDWLIDETAGDEAATLKARNGALRRTLESPGLQMPGAANNTTTTTTLTTGPAERAATLTAHQRSLLAQWALPQLVPPTFAQLQTREAYQKTCASLGVPLPRAWGAAGAWASKGRLTAPFIITGAAAELWVGNPRPTDPPGVCLALPRYDGTLPRADQKASLLGVICMAKDEKTDRDGKTGSHACFWDWQGFGTTTIPVVGTEVPISEFKSAPEFRIADGGECSDCHAGANAYVRHPDDVAFQGIANLQPAAWPVLRVLPTWKENLLPTKLELALAAVTLPADGDCSACHRLGEVPSGLAGYCSDVLLPSILGKTVRGPVPAGSPPGTLGPVLAVVKKTMPRPTSTDDFSKQIVVLKAECKRIGVEIEPAPP
jgi:hypothetical protein